MIDSTNSLAATHMHSGLGCSMIGWSLVVLLFGPLCGASTACSSPTRGCSRSSSRSRPSSILQGLAIKILPEPGGSIPLGYSNVLANTDGPLELLFVGSRSPCSGSCCRRTRLGVGSSRSATTSRPRARHGMPVRARQDRAPTSLARHARRRRRALPRRDDDRRRRDAGRRLHPHVDRGRRARRDQLLRRPRQRARLDRGRVHPHAPHQRPLLRRASTRSTSRSSRASSSSSRCCSDAVLGICGERDVTPSCPTVVAPRAGRRDADRRRSARASSRSSQRSSSSSSAPSSTRASRAGRA